MYRRKLLLMLSALMVGIIAMAAPRTAEQAKKIAAEQARRLGITNAQPLLMEKASPRRAPGIGTTDANYYYVFNNEGGKGFTIVSGDDIMPEIVGYSDNGSFSEDNMPANVKSFLKAYEQTLDNVAEGDVRALQIVDELKARRAESTGTYTVGDILLGNIQWDQTEPYNLLCPVYTDENGNEWNSVTGCGATAIAQIMRYHKWPKELTVDIPDYTTEYFAPKQEWEGVKVGQEGHPYDWDNMLEEYFDEYWSPLYNDEQALAVAQLMSDVGRAMKMEYGRESTTYNTAPFTALTDYFNYDPDLIQMIFRNMVSLAQWTEIIKKDINENRPVYYYGNSNAGGHMFVCDGYDSNDLFHINWGWGGYCDGFFDITVLNPNSNDGTGASVTADGFDMLNTIIVGIQPDNGVVDEPMWDIPQLYADKYLEPTITKSTRINQNEEFSISTGLMCFNISNKTFKGEIGLAIIDKDENIQIIDKNQFNIEPINGLGPIEFDYAFPVGTSTVVLVEKPAGSSEWRLVNVAMANAITLIATETELAFAEPELLSLNVLTQEIPAGKSDIVFEVINNTSKDYYGRISIYVTNAKEEYEANKEELMPIITIPLGLDRGQSIKKSVTLSTTDMNQEYWLTFCDGNGNVIGETTVKTVTNPEPTFVITGYSIDGEEITYESEIVNKETWSGSLDMALVHNIDAPTIEIRVKNIGADGTFKTRVYNECDGEGYPTFRNHQEESIDIPSGETRSILSKAANIGESLCLWSLYSNGSKYTPFLVGDVPYGRVTNDGDLLHIHAYNDGISTGISIPTMDFELTDKIYTIDGKRVKTPTEKGIYIIGNKKVVVK